MSEEVFLLPGSQTQLSNIKGDYTALGQLSKDVETISDHTDIMSAYAKYKHEYDTELSIQSVITAGLAAAQMIIYWDLFDEYLDKRDETLDMYITFLEKCRARTFNVDLPELRRIRNVLDDDNLDEFSRRYHTCEEGKRFVYSGDHNDYTRLEVHHDGEFVNRTNMDTVNKATKEGFIPDGWGLHEGWIASAMSAGISTSLGNHLAKHRYYDFLRAKARLLHTAQQAMKAVIKASRIEEYYRQAAAIYSGLSDVFIQGFNSGGAALGTALGRLSNMGGGSSSNASTGTRPMVRIGMGEYDG